MKITFIKTLFFVAITAGLGATAQAEDLPGGQVISGKTVSKPTYVQEYQAIVDVLNKYSEGCKQAKSSIMKPAFSERATIFSVDAKGKLVGGPIQGLFHAIDNPPFRPFGRLALVAPPALTVLPTTLPVPHEPCRRGALSPTVQRPHPGRLCAKKRP